MAVLFQCDRCLEIHDSCFSIRKRIGWLWFGFLRLGGREAEVFLCEECTEELKRWLDVEVMDGL